MLAKEYIGIVAVESNKGTDDGFCSRLAHLATQIANMIEMEVSIFSDGVERRSKTHSSYITLSF